MYVKDINAKFRKIFMQCKKNGNISMNGIFISLDISFCCCCCCFLGFFFKGFIYKIFTTEFTNCTNIPCNVMKMLPLLNKTYASWHKHIKTPK